MYQLVFYLFKNHLTKLIAIFKFRYWVAAKICPTTQFILILGVFIPVIC